MRALVGSGCRLLGCASLDDRGAARYSVGVSEQLVAAGMPVAALSPLELARWSGTRSENLPPVARTCSPRRWTRCRAGCARLDETVDQARTWPVEAGSDGVVVTVDDQQVRLAARVLTPADAVCSCLLAPRCLHRTALLAAAPVLADEPSPAPDPPPSGSPVSGPPPGAGWDEASLTAAAMLWRAATPVLETGLPGAGAVAQAQLLRAVHEARGAGLPRAAAAGVRVVEGLRLGRADEARFRLADLSDDLRELLTVCHQITGGHGEPAQVRGCPGGSTRTWAAVACGGCSPSRC